MQLYLLGFKRDVNFHYEDGYPAYTYGDYIEYGEEVSAHDYFDKLAKRKLDGIYSGVAPYILLNENDKWAYPIFNITRLSEGIKFQLEDGNWLHIDIKENDFDLSKLDYDNLEVMRKGVNFYDYGADGIGSYNKKFRKLRPRSTGYNFNYWNDKFKSGRFDLLKDDYDSILGKLKSRQVCPRGQRFEYGNSRKLKSWKNIRKRRQHDSFALSPRGKEELEFDIESLQSELCI